MKKRFIILIMAALMLSAFTQSDPERKYVIWHVTPSGNVTQLHLPYNAAIMHLQNHPEDFCHGRACPEPIIIPI